MHQRTLYSFPSKIKLPNMPKIKKQTKPNPKIILELNIIFNHRNCLLFIIKLYKFFIQISIFYPYSFSKQGAFLRTKINKLAQLIFFLRSFLFFWVAWQKKRNEPKKRKQTLPKETVKCFFDDFSATSCCKNHLKT